ncbi:hypothetical protein PSPO01_06305 [Paraphaeosphaeria sporulosa]
MSAAGACEKLWVVKERVANVVYPRRRAFSVSEAVEGSQAAVTVTGSQWPCAFVVTTRVAVEHQKVQTLAAANRAKDIHQFSEPRTTRLSPPPPHPSPLPRSRHTILLHHAFLQIIMRPIIIPPPKFQNVAIALEVASAAYFSYELSRIYRGTHPVLSRRLAENGIWPPPQLPAVKGGAKVEGDDKKEVDVRWMSINGVPVPASFDALNFWRRG